MKMYYVNLYIRTLIFLAPDDYIGVTEGVTFLVGDFISQTVEITIIDDILCEILEAFEVRASTTSPGVRINGMEQMDTLRVNIIDNDCELNITLLQTCKESNAIFLSLPLCPSPQTNFNPINIVTVHAKKPAISQQKRFCS